MEEFEESHDYTVTEVINRFKSTLEQEIGIIKDKDNNWTNKATIYDKEIYYDLEHLIISNIVNSAKDLYASLGGRGKDEAPVGHKWLSKLVNAVNFHTKRVDSFLRKENQLTTKIEKDNIEDFKKTIGFRNKVKNNQTTIKKNIKGISSGDDVIPESPIRLHKKTEFIPLSCRFVVENKYPEIVNIINKKRELNNKINNQDDDYDDDDAEEDTI